MGAMKKYAEDVSYKLGYEGEIDAEILEIANDKFNLEFARSKQWGTLGERILAGMKLMRKVRAKRNFSGQNELTADEEFDIDNPAHSVQTNCNRRYELQCQACDKRFAHQSGDDFCLLGEDMESIIVCTDWRMKDDTLHDR